MSLRAHDVNRTVLTSLSGTLFLHEWVQRVKNDVGDKPKIIFVLAGWNEDISNNLLSKKLYWRSQQQ